MLIYKIAPKKPSSMNCEIHKNYFLLQIL